MSVNQEKTILEREFQQLDFTDKNYPSKEMEPVDILIAVQALLSTIYEACLNESQLEDKSIQDLLTQINSLRQALASKNDEVKRL